MVAYYQHDIAAWMDGTESLPDGEYRVYHVVCELIYLNNGPIVMNESGIAGRCNQHPLKFRSNFAKLMARKKLSLNDGGKITNARVVLELQKIASRRRDPKPTSASPQGGQPGVSRGSQGGKASKPLKTKDPDMFDSKEKKKREDSEANASALSSMQLARKELFDRGKEMLGQTAGGMIQQLLAVKHGNVALARAAVEQASTMDNPRQYIGAIISRGGPNGKAETAIDPNRLGFAGQAALRRHRIAQGPERCAPEDLEPVNRR